MKSYLEDYFKTLIFNYHNLGYCSNFAYELWVDSYCASLNFFGKDLMYHFISFDRKASGKLEKESITKFKLLNGDETGFHLYNTNDFDKFVAKCMDYCGIDKMPIVHDENHFVRMIYSSKIFENNIRFPMRQRLMDAAMPTDALINKQKKKYRVTKCPVEVYVTNIQDSELEETNDLVQSIGSMLLLYGVSTAIEDGKYRRNIRVNINAENATVQLAMLSEIDAIWNKVFPNHKNMIYRYLTYSSTGIAVDWKIMSTPESIKERRYNLYRPYDYYDEEYM